MARTGWCADAFPECQLRSGRISKRYGTISSGVSIASPLRKDWLPACEETAALRSAPPGQEAALAHKGAIGPPLPSLYSSVFPDFAPWPPPRRFGYHRAERHPRTSDLASWQRRIGTGRREGVGLRIPDLTALTQFSKLPSICSRGFLESVTTRSPGQASGVSV